MDEFGQVKFHQVVKSNYLWQNGIRKILNMASDVAFFMCVAYSMDVAYNLSKHPNVEALITQTLIDHRPVDQL